MAWRKILVVLKPWRFQTTSLKPGLRQLQTDAFVFQRGIFINFFYLCGIKFKETSLYVFSFQNTHWSFFPQVDVCLKSCQAAYQQTESMRTKLQTVTIKQECTPNCIINSFCFSGVCYLRSLWLQESGISQSKSCNWGRWVVLWFLPLTHLNIWIWASYNQRNFLFLL